MGKEDDGLLSDPLPLGGGGGGGGQKGYDLSVGTSNTWGGGWPCGEGEGISDRNGVHEGTIVKAEGHVWAILKVNTPFVDGNLFFLVDYSIHFTRSPNLVTLVNFRRT